MFLLKPKARHKLIRFFSAQIHPNPFSNRNPYPSETEIAFSFKHWFESSSNSVLDQIYSILSSVPEGSALESSLSSLNLTLSESLVLSTLKHNPHPSLRLNDSDLLNLRLKFFDWAGHQVGSYRHTRAAYHSILKILSKTKKVTEVLQWLDQFSSTRTWRQKPYLGALEDLYAGARFHDTLVVGYAVLGQPERALNCFAKMRFQGLDLDSFSYHVLLNSFVDADEYEIEEMLVEQIESKRFRCSVTDCIRMKSLCKRRLFDEGIKFLAKLREAKVEEIEIATATLVHGLCKNGRLDEAVALVEEAGASKSYGIVATNLAEAGKVDSAIKFLRSKKDLEGYSLGDASCNKLLNELMIRNELEYVYDALVEMMQEGIVPSRATMNAALCLFCKAGLVRVAMYLYKARHELGITPSKWVYNHLIISLCQNGDVEEVCRVLEEGMQDGYFPKKQTFSILANMFCREDRFEKLHVLLKGTYERAVKPSNVILARCISGFCKQGELEKACAVRHMFGGNGAGFARFEQVYTGLIHAFISLGKVEMLPQLIIQMQEAGHTPSRSIYVAVVQSLYERDRFEDVCYMFNKQLDVLKKHSKLEVSNLRTFYNYIIEGATHARKLEIAAQVYNLMETGGIKANMDTKIIMLLGYLMNNQVSNAMRYFSFICSGGAPSTRLYNIYISGLCKAGQAEQAIELWQEMRVKGMVPTLKCYEELVLALCNESDYYNVVRVLEDFSKIGHPFSLFIFNLILLHTLKGKELLRAWINFKNGVISSETLNQGPSLGELIAAYADGIRRKENFLEVEEELVNYFSVNTNTYNTLLRGSSMAGRMDYACKLYTRMLKRGYEPNLWTYDVIVHGFCKLGMRKEAEQWTMKMSQNGYTPTKYTMRLLAYTM